MYTLHTEADDKEVPEKHEWINVDQETGNLMVNSNVQGDMSVYIKYKSGLQTGWTNKFRVKNTCDNADAKLMDRPKAHEIVLAKEEKGQEVTATLTKTTIESWFA